MGLGITIYFYGGGSESGQRKVLEVFKRYQEQYSKYLNGLFFEEHQRFVKFSAAQFEKSMEKSQKTAQRDERLEAHISSERKSDYAPDYHCSTLTTSPTGEFEYNLLSYLSLTFSIGWLKDETRRAEFEEWVDYLCAQFDVLHGYAGLECILPYDPDEWEPHEYQVATHYYNVMPNCNAYAGLRDYKDAAKSIAWYTILGKSLSMRIEPQVWARLAEQYPEITVKTQATPSSKAYAVPTTTTAPPIPTSLPKPTTNNPKNRPTTPSYWANNNTGAFIPKPPTKPKFRRPC